MRAQITVILIFYDQKPVDMDIDRKDEDNKKLRISRRQYRLCLRRENRSAWAQKLHQHFQLFRVTTGVNVQTGTANMQRGATFRYVA